MMKKTKTPGWYRAKNLLIIAIAFIVVLLTSTFETRVIAQSVKKDPVVIINGKTYDYNVVKNLDPSHIERIDVLKDSTATIVYGSKGKNGVIIIHTSDPDSVLDKSLTDNKTYELRTLKIRHADRDSVAEIKVVRNTKTGDDFFLVESKNDSVKLFTTMRSEKNSGNFNNCLVFYDDKKISSEELKKIDPSKIKKIEVLKGSVAFEKYGREAENGVVLAYSYKRNNITGDAMPKNSLFIINGREVKGDELSNINPDDISTVNVTKNSEGRAVAIKLKTTSSENNGETTALMLSPNPASDIVNISINSDDLMTNENCRITVISMEGKVVYKTKKSGKNFDIPVSKLKSGNYIVVVSTGKSSFSSNLSIVK